MNEETKEYLKRVDELELKLTGEDKETYQWVLFGYNECARLLNEAEQENQSLKDRIEKAIEHIGQELLVYDNESDEYDVGIKLLEILKGDKE